MSDLKLREPQAEIRIGIIPRAYWETEVVEWESCFSLMIDGELVPHTRKKITEAYTRKSLACVAVGEEYREILNQKGVKPQNYNFVRGERARSENGEIISCHPSFDEDYSAFEKAVKGISKKKGFMGIASNQ